MGLMFVGAAILLLGFIAGVIFCVMIASSRGGDDG